MAGARGGGATLTEADFLKEWGDTVPLNAFRGRRDLVGMVVIPARFRKIGVGAFRGCSGLTEIRLPDTLTKIGDEAFWGCSGLTELRIPDTLTEIGDRAFCGCSGLTELRLPETLTEIRECAFEWCSGLTELRLPDTLAEIGVGPFRGCSGLTEIRLPDTLTEIGEYAFDGCSGLTELRLPDTLTEIRYRAFFRCSGLTELRLPNTPGPIKSLGGGAFSGCTSLRLVAMHSVTQFAQCFDGTFGQFRGCTSLTAVSAPVELASRFPADIFEGCGAAPSALLAAATADLALWYFWSRQSHLRCSPVAKDTVLAVMLVGLRLHRKSSRRQSSRRPQLPALPGEIWCCVLELVRRHELAAVF